MNEKLASLRAELLTIALWDSEYEKEKNHSEIEKSAYLNRRNRKSAIVAEISKCVQDDNRSPAVKEKTCVTL